MSKSKANGSICIELLILIGTPTPFIPQRNGNKAGGRALTGTRRSLTPLSLCRGTRQRKWLRRETLICGLVSPHRMSASRRGTDVASPYPWTFSSRRSRDAEAAILFLRKALSAVHTQEHSVINVDKNAAYPKAVDELIEKKELSLQVELRQRKYLNNIASARPSLDKTTSQTRNGVRLIQYSAGVH